METFTRNPRDRRQHRRYLTLRNARNVLILLAVMFIAVSLLSELRGPAKGEPGRLLQERAKQKIEPIAVVQPVVEESISQDSAAADPRLLDAAAREQYLGVQPTFASQPAAGYVVVDQPGAPLLSGGSFVDVDDEAHDYEAPGRTHVEGSRIVIAGDGNGVAIQTHDPDGSGAQRAPAPFDP